MYSYRFSPQSLKQFKKLDRKVQFRIIAKVDFFCLDTNPMKYAEPISDKELGDWRFRIGNYRVIFDVQDNIIKILRVGHRKDVYK